MDAWLDAVEGTISLGVREMACRLNLASRNFDKTAENLQRTAQLGISGEFLRQVVEGEGKAVQKAAAAGQLPLDWDYRDCLAHDKDGKKTGQYLGSLMLSASRRTQHPKEVAQFINFMVHEPEVAKIMGYDRGVPATQTQYDAFKPTDPVNKAIAEYEESLVTAGVLEPITPHPNGADICEAGFMRIAEELALGKRSVDDAVKQFFTESKTALASSPATVRSPSRRELVCMAAVYSIEWGGKQAPAVGPRYVVIRTL